MASVINELETERQANIKSDLEKRPLLAKDYVDALRSVNLDSVESIENFVARALTINYRPPPEMVILGREDDVVFCFRPGVSFLNVEPNPGVPDGDKHPFLIELRRTDGGESDIRFALVLGAVQRAQAGVMPTQNQEVLPLHIYMSYPDKSLWMVLDKTYTDDLGDSEDITDAEGWEYCCLDQAGRPPFGAIRLLVSSNLPNLGAKRTLFTPKVLSTAKKYNMIPRVAGKSEVEHGYWRMDIRSPTSQEDEDRSS